MLRTALRPAIVGFLEDAAIVEVMLNPDSRLWIDRLSSGLTYTGKKICPSDGVRIIRVVAHYGCRGSSREPTDFCRAARDGGAL
ncbi:Flp pilus assembly CpaF family ATPase [Bradyrhizobium sp. LM6.10]